MFGYTLCAQKYFSFCWKRWLSVSSLRVHVSVAHYSLWTTNIFRFSRSVTKGFSFLRRPKNQLNMFWRYLFSNISKRKMCLSFNQQNFQFLRLLKVHSVFYVFNIPFTERKATKTLFGGDGTDCFAAKTSRNYEKKYHLLFDELCPPITIKHTRTCAKKEKNNSVYGKSVSIPLWLMQLTENSFAFPIYTLSVYSKGTFFPRLQRRYRVVSRLWTRFRYSDCQRSRPRYNKKKLKMFLWLLGACCGLKNKTFWSTIQGEIQLPPTGKVPWRWATKCFHL